jgi:membrane protease YdiL (CAAX protease family)
MEPRSRARRAAESAGLVAAWMGLGYALRLDANEYLVAGVPLTAAFQRWVRRRPLRELWVRAAPPIPRDALTMGAVGALAALPLYKLARAVSGGAPWSINTWYLCAAGGAVGAAYALRSFRRSGVRPLLVCLATAGGTGILLMVLAQSARGPLPPVSARTAQDALIWLVLYFPVTFVLEEVTFRGALDAHLHEPGEGRALGSALLGSALWGVWHLPISAPHGFSALTVGSLVVVHSLIGVPLAWGWRRSGNLAVPALAHALVDAVRNAILR